jgi:CDGSH-type Zn-finger protein
MDDAVIIKVRDNGPYLVTGPVRIIDAEGNLYEATGNVALCRCGESSEKPFCDGTHKTCAFSAISRAPQE